MTRQPISCATLVDPSKSAFVIFHQQLGCFHSDWHQHEWGQLIYAEKGCIHLKNSGQKVLLPSWYGVWIPALTYHEIWSDSAQLHMRAICFPMTTASESWSHSIAVFPLSGLLREMIRHTEKWMSVQEESTQARTFLRAIQDLLPEEVAKAIPVYLPSTTHQKLVPVVDYLQQHLPESIRFAELANQFGFSTRTLNRLFSQYLGISFSGYRKLARIMRSLELIEEGTDTVSQLAFEVGYSSLATFSTNFLEICGHRPIHFIHGRNQ